MASLIAKDINGAIAVFDELSDSDFTKPRKDQIVTFLETFLENFRNHMQQEKAANYAKVLNATPGLEISPNLLQNIMLFISGLRQVHVHVPRQK